jgi:hypothetical protein
MSRRRYFIIALLVGCSGDDGGSTLDASAGPDSSESGCNVYLSTGCTPEEKCTFVHAEEGFGELTCSPAGPQAEGQPCTIDDQGQDDCAATLYCSAGECRGFCTIPTAPCSSGYCENGSGAHVCLADCDPLASDCAGALTCYLPDLFRDSQTPGCATAGTSAVGETCLEPHDCVAGATCDSGTCAWICAVGSNDCDVAEICEAWTPGAPYGVCVAS